MLSSKEGIVFLSRQGLFARLCEYKGDLNERMHFLMGGFLNARKPTWYILNGAVCEQSLRLLYFELYSCTELVY